MRRSRLSLSWRIRCFVADLAAGLGRRIGRSRPVGWIARQRAAVFVARIAPIVWHFAADRVWWPAKRLARRGYKSLRRHEVLAWIATWLVCTGLGQIILLPSTGYLRLALGVLGAAAFVIISVRSPLTGLLLWLGTAPLLDIYTRFKFLPGTPVITGSRFCLMMLLAVYLFRQSRESKPGKNFSLHACMFMFVAAMLMAALHAEKPKWAGQEVLDGYLMPILVYLFARRWVSDRRSLSIAFIILILVGFYFAGFALPEHFTGKNLFKLTNPFWVEEELGTVRVQGPAESPTEFGVIVIASMILTLVKLSHEPRSGKKFLYAVCLALMAMAVYATLRRSVYVGVVLAFVCMLFAGPKPRKTAFAIMAVGIFALAVSWQSVMSSKFYSVRIRDLKPVYSRAVTQATTLNMIEHHPIFGIGVNRFPAVKPDYLTPYKNISVDYGAGIGTPHNSYLRVMVEGGAVAFVPFFGMIVLMLATSVGAWRRCREGGLLGRDGIVVFWVLSAVFLSQSLQEDTFWYCKYASALWFFCYGAVAGVHLRSPLEPVPEREPRRSGVLQPASSVAPARR